MLIKHYVVAGALIVGAAGGWHLADSKHKSYLLKVADRYEQAIAKAQEETNKAKQEAREIDAKYTKQLAAASADIDRMRANPERVLVRATCPELPREADGAGVGDGASARLDDAAVRNYFLLRERIGRITAQLGACQDLLRQ